MNDVVLQTLHGLGKGRFWWEPAASGNLRARGYFDDEGNALPVFEVFHRFTRQPRRVDGQEPPELPPFAVPLGPAR